MDLKDRWATDRITVRADNNNARPKKRRPHKRKGKVNAKLDKTAK